MKPTEVKLHTLEEVAEILGDDLATVHELVRIGRLSHRLVGRELMVAGEDLLAYITA